MIPITEPLTLSAFDYALPESLIAQQPSTIRDQSRLMVLQRAAGSVEHHVFSEIEKYLVPGDILVLNNTKVFHCRLKARRRGGGKGEIFLLAERRVNIWNALVKGRLSPGKTVSLDRGIKAEVIADNGDGTKEIRFHGITDIRKVLPEIGKIPLPPYIKREPSDADRERYQTVYASREGAVAAPTAGLHFTPDLLQTLRAKGIEIVAVTLHVGPGTFQPVRTDVITDHRMLPEQYHISSESAAAINKAKMEGRRIIAVGTTSVRALESSVSENGAVRAGSRASELFIYPGFAFRITDAIITNFHLPKSTLLMLVSAFAGRERILNAYRIAVSELYRFYSYGDAMLIL